MEFLWILEELDEFLQLLLGLVDSGHVFERNASRLFGKQSGAGFAEPHGLAATGLHLAHEEYPNAQDQQHGEPRDKDAPQTRRTVIRRQCPDAHALFVELGNQVGVVGGIGREGTVVVIHTVDRAALDGDFLDFAAVHFFKKLGIGQARLRSAWLPALKQVEQGKHQQRDDHPERQVPAEVHEIILSFATDGWIEPRP